VARAIKKNEKGFAAAQFVPLMALSLMLLTGFLNIIFVEYNRNSVLSSLRDGARAGTRITDLNKAQSNPDTTNLDTAISECKTRGEDSLKDLMDIGSMSIQCSVIINASGVATMKASLVGTPDVTIVPWADPISKLRLKNLSQSFVQRQAAQ
jgi:hypothetical protein